MNKNVIYAALMFVVTMSSGNASAQQFPYQNPALSAHERAVDLCGRLTLEEKASLMLDDSPAIPRLGIKRFQWWSEALHGVANMGDVTVFPEPIGMAASTGESVKQADFKVPASGVYVVKAISENGEHTRKISVK